MKTPNISHARVKSLLDYNQETGDLTWRVNQGLGRAGRVAGVVHNGRVKITIDREQLIGHRLIWFYVQGVWPSGQIDHIDGNPLNNRIANLRDVSQSMNIQNRYVLKRKDSALPMGVSRTPSGKFSANIRIGVFASIGEAHAAFMAAKRLLHKGCTR